MNFIKPQPDPEYADDNSWISTFRDKALDVLQDLILEYGVEVDLSFRWTKNNEVKGFYFYLDEYPDVHYESIEELRRALKNKSFI